MSDEISLPGKGMGPWLATFLVAGNMIGSGLYLLPVTLAPYGSSSLIGWLAATLGAIAIAGVFAILGALRPDADGVLAYPSQSLHPVAGFIAWAAYWSSSWAGNVAIGLAAVGYLETLFHLPTAQTTTLVLLLAILWVFTLVNFAGAKAVAGLSGATLVLGLIPVLAAAVLGLAHFSPAIFRESWNPSHAPLHQSLPPMVVAIFWAFLGLECANAAAAKVDNPRRNLPIAALGGVALAGGVYILACVAVQGVMPAAELAKSTAPFADVVARLAGPMAGGLIALLAALKACGTLAGWTLVTAETGRAGVHAGYLPRFLSEADPEALPRRGLILTGVLMTVSALASVTPSLAGQFNLLINLAVALFMLVYALCGMALIREAGRIRRPHLRLAARALAVAVILFSGWVIWAFALGPKGL